MLITVELERLRDGQSDFRLAFVHLWPMLVATAKRFGHAEADAEDIAQGALLCTLEELTKFDGTRDGAAWVRTIARFQALTVRRGRLRRREEGLPPDDLLRADTDLDRALDDQRRLMHFEQMLSRLTDSELALVADAAPHAPARSCSERKRKQRVIARMRGYVMAAMRREV